MLFEIESLKNIGIKSCQCTEWFVILLILVIIDNNGNKGSGLHGQNKKHQRDSNEINAGIGTFAPGKNTKG